MEIPHKPKIYEKLFFLFSGAVISTPFPALANSLITFLLMANLPITTASIISIAIVAPILEEFAKAYPLFYRHGETERSIFILGFLTGLGFGIAEFFLYVYGFGAPIVIRLPLILFHAAATTIVAYGIAKYQALYFYIIAVILHFLYNLSIIMSGNWTYIAVTTVVITYFLSYYLYKQTKEKMIDGWI